MHLWKTEEILVPRGDDGFKDCRKQRDQANETAIESNYISDWQIYGKLRNYVTKLNRVLINNIKHQNKKLLNTFNDIMGRTSKPTSSSLKSEGNFMTKPP